MRELRGQRARSLISPLVHGDQLGQDAQLKAKEDMRCSGGIIKTALDAC
jgi:hypothetical protein